MASNIDSTSIDATFPVAGQDNNSQGFRDNFNTIKSNFASAKSEITTLQDNTAKLNANNNFAGNELSGAKLKGNFIKSHTFSASQNETINLEFGNFQVITVGADVTLTLDNFSDQNDAMESVLVHIVKTGDDRTIEFDVNGGTLKTDSNFPNPFVADGEETNPKVVEFYSYDKGVTVFARYIGQFA